jgi:hypothetical protein
MSILPTVFGIVLATSSVVLAQTSETKPPDVSVSGVGSSQSASTPSPNPCRIGALDQAEILTDTKGVDFGPYLTGDGANCEEELVHPYAAIGVPATLEAG